MSRTEPSSVLTGRDLGVAVGAFLFGDLAKDLAVVLHGVYERGQHLVSGDSMSFGADRVLEWQLGGLGICQLVVLLWFYERTRSETRAAVVGLYLAGIAAAVDLMGKWLTEPEVYGDGPPSALFFLLVYLAVILGPVTPRPGRVLRLDAALDVLRERAALLLAGAGLGAVTMALRESGRIVVGADNVDVGSLPNPEPYVVLAWAVAALSWRAGAGQTWAASRWRAAVVLVGACALTAVYAFFDKSAAAIPSHVALTVASVGTVLVAQWPGAGVLGQFVAAIGAVAIVSGVYVTGDVATWNAAPSALVFALPALLWPTLVRRIGGEGPASADVVASAQPG
jgi:hypothetical protein